MSRTTRVMVVGQTPPPYHGQSIMIDRIVEARYSSVAIRHVRMDFSDDLAEVGRFRLRKIVRLFLLVGRIYWNQLRFRASVLYYPPAGPPRAPQRSMVAVYRDFAVLIAIRWLFKKTVFHFHATGLSTLYGQLGPVRRALYRAAYSRPHVAIEMADLQPHDGRALDAKSVAIVPYGIPDVSGRFSRQEDASPFRILFVGLLCESKGVLILLEACHILAGTGAEFEIEFVGRFESSAFETLASKRASSLGLDDRVKWSGELTGDDKWSAYGRADVFCFPTHYESEGMPVVLLEALSFGLPIVTTEWRLIPAAVGESGAAFMVKPREPEAVAMRLRRLAGDDVLREKMSQAARRHFRENFELTRFVERIEAALVSV